MFRGKTGKTAMENDPFIGCYRYLWDTYRYLQNVMGIYRVLYDMYRVFFPDFIAFPSCNLDIAMENQ
jgi:hypothetical protein